VVVAAAAGSGASWHRPPFNCYIDIDTNRAIRVTTVEKNGTHHELATGQSTFSTVELAEMRTKADNIQRQAEEAELDVPAKHRFVRSL
jgi:hypothetical protein